MKVSFEMRFLWPLQYRCCCEGHKKLRSKKNPFCSYFNMGIFYGALVEVTLQLIFLTNYQKSWPSMCYLRWLIFMHGSLYYMRVRSYCLLCHKWSQLECILCMQISLLYTLLCVALYGYQWRIISATSRVSFYFISLFRHVYGHYGQNMPISSSICKLQQNRWYFWKLDKNSYQKRFTSNCFVYF